ncbi:type I restriction endonuclease subunit R [Sphingomonas sp.]|uniref:type I restriction endonuclease subunit R n=1 Tax=Sphingomonas sp. TaxID=28214 RepID=UPI003CC5EF86
MTGAEAQIERDLIDKLQALKYEYRPDIQSRHELERNFRAKFDQLNRVTLSDTEFQRLLEKITTPDVFAAASSLRERDTIERDDGTPLNYTLVNIRDWCKNTFEVVNQLRINTDDSHHRYDVILLINGVPVVQIELKAHAVSPRRAMQQIVDYKSEQGTGYRRTLLCYIQLFVVSNRVDTWYFANNNAKHFSFDADERFLPVYQFAAEDNKKIVHLDQFAEKFLAKCTLGQMISRYMVIIASEQKLLMMRPYQIYAVKAIVDCIRQNVGNGYVWHTTGSGKTLTSFKASTLLKDDPNIEKCLFVVDRKDLDRQTREEFNRFQPGCVEENTNTEALVRRLLSDDYADKVIVTTIQKLGLALGDGGKRNYKARLQPLAGKRVAFIFDECHRSQFGENHKAIKEFFPHAQLFGFTGTPIFETNARYEQVEGEQASLRTTETLFERCLHEYTITHAIEDRNVLRFHIDYYKAEGDAPKPGEGPRKEKVVETILAKHDAATADRRFNAILATGSINEAIEYWEAFKAIQAARLAADPDFRPLNVACVFSPPAEGDADVRQLQEDLAQEVRDNQVDPDAKKTALKAIIDDHNTRYGTNHRIDEFDLYYQDVQKRIKAQQWPNADLPRSQKIDVVIVVDMLLTGFDSKFLNTLYVDKRLRHHGLIQAFSRTNRVLNDSKPYGNILDFRGQQDSVDEAIALFSGESTEAPAAIWLVDPAPKVIGTLSDAVKRLDEFMTSQGLEPRPEEVPNLKGDGARSTFVELFKGVQRLKTQLDQYTDLGEEQKAEIARVAPLEALQGFRSAYLETAQRLRAQQRREGDDAAPEVRDLDFEFVLFASAVVDYDYIMGLIAKMTQAPAGKRTLSRERLIGLIQADAKFIDERDDITDYIRGLPVDQPLEEAEIKAGYQAFKTNKEAAELTAIAERHDLDVAALQAFVDEIVRRRVFDEDALRELMAPLGLGWKARAQAELALMEALTPQLHRLAEGRVISGLSAYEQ